MPPGLLDTSAGDLVETRSRLGVRPVHDRRPPQILRPWYRCGCASLAVADRLGCSFDAPVRRERPLRNCRQQWCCRSL